MSEPGSGVPQYSFVVPVAARVGDLSAIVAEYLGVLDSLGARYELIVVLDGPRPELVESLRGLAENSAQLKIIELSKRFGESAALMAGFNESRGELLVTLPAYYQVEVQQIPKLIEALEPDDDMLIAVRWPRAASYVDRIRRGVFHGLFRLISGMNYRDLGCGVRLLRRAVVGEIPLYGDQHRFFPALALRRGFRVREVELPQSSKDWYTGGYRVREYLHRILDILTVFFLVRFTKKPLRFFGTIGFLSAAVGGLAVVIIVVQRLFFSMPLAERPALLLASLLIVLGVQTFALGLIGELIIFTHAAGMKEYAIRRIMGGDERGRLEE
jgi:glycosyltransferase involved in cell wall biosynthesis